MPGEVHINHEFVSAKAQSANTTIVSKNEWNADEILSGGVDGDVIMKDSTQNSGAKWVEGPVASRASDSFSGGGTSGEMSSRVVIVAERSYVLLWVEVGVLTSGGASVQVDLRRDGVNVIAWATIGTLVDRKMCGMWVQVESNSTHTWSIKLTASGGTITSSNTVLSVLTLGRL